jgi:hypothetical protein
VAVVRIRAVRLLVGAALALAVMAAVGAGSRFSYAPPAAADASLRLAWRARVPLVEECVRLTEAEKEALPIHMRRDVVCEGRVATYSLSVVVDGEVRHRSTVAGAGARGDRPLYVFESIPLPAGRHALVVEFSRLGEAPDSTVQSAGVGAETVPERLLLRRTIEVSPGQVVLVSYDHDRRKLVLRE